jgi:hypothetical protein
MFNTRQHWCPIFLRQRTSPVIKDWFGSCTWKNKNEGYTCAPELLCDFLFYTSSSKRPQGVIRELETRAIKRIKDKHLENETYKKDTFC